MAATENYYEEDPSIAASDPRQNPIAHQAHAGTIFDRNGNATPSSRPMRDEPGVTNLKRVLEPGRIGSDFPDPRTLGANVFKGDKSPPKDDGEVHSSMPNNGYDSNEETGHRRAAASMTRDPLYNDLNQAPDDFANHPGNRNETVRTTFTSNDTQLPPRLEDNPGAETATGFISPLAPDGFIDAAVPAGLTAGKFAKATGADKSSNNANDGRTSRGTAPAVKSTRSDLTDV